jgi:hypothetical protein
MQQEWHWGCRRERERERESQSIGDEKSHTISLQLNMLPVSVEN